MSVVKESGLKYSIMWEIERDRVIKSEDNWLSDTVLNAQRGR